MVSQRKLDIKEVINLDEFEAFFSDFYSKQDSKKYKKVNIKYYGLSMALIGFNGESDIELELRGRHLMKKKLVSMVTAITKRINQ